MFTNIINIIINLEAIVEGTIKLQIQLLPIQCNRSHLPWLQMRDNRLNNEGMADDGMVGPNIIRCYQHTLLTDWIKEDCHEHHGQVPQGA